MARLAIALLAVAGAALNASSESHPSTQPAPAPMAEGGPVGEAPATGERGGAPLTLLLYHPFPDSADPLGFPAPGADRDPFSERYGSLAPTGFEFPYAVIDGVTPVAGIPDSDVPYDSTLTAYSQAFAARGKAEAPAVLRVSTQPEGTAWLASIAIEPVRAVPEARLNAWVALVEDHVAYQAPAALSNGIDDHRFTVRAIADLGPVDLASVTVLAHTFQPTGPESQIYIAAWLQNGAAEAVFAPREVAQATTHPLTSTTPTVQRTKGVLVEMLSAVWCRPCLYGDLAAAELVERHGLAAFQEQPVARSYWRPGPWLPATVAMVLGATVAVLLTRPPRRPTPAQAADGKGRR